MTVKTKSSGQVTVLIRLDNTSRKIADSLSGKALASRVKTDSARFKSGFIPQNKKSR